MPQENRMCVFFFLKSESYISKNHPASSLTVNTNTCLCCCLFRSRWCCFCCSNGFEAHRTWCANGAMEHLGCYALPATIMAMSHKWKKEPAMVMSIGLHQQFDQHIGEAHYTSSVESVELKNTLNLSEGQTWLRRRLTSNQESVPMHVWGSWDTEANDVSWKHLESVLTIESWHTGLLHNIAQELNCPDTRTFRCSLFSKYVKTQFLVEMQK